MTRDSREVLSGLRSSQEMTGGARASKETRQVELQRLSPAGVWLVTGMPNVGMVTARSVGSARAGTLAHTAQDSVISAPSPRLRWSGSSGEEEERA